MSAEFSDIEGKECRRVANLFANHKRWRIAIDGVLEGIAGTITVDNKENPGAARINFSSTSLFGGDPSLDSARDLMTSTHNSVIPETDAWRTLLLEVHEGHLDKYTRRDFTPERLDPVYLVRLRDELPEEYSLKRMDLELTRQVVDQIGTVCLGTFMSAEDFSRVGIGHCILLDDRPVSAATSADISSKGIGIQITTHQEFWRKGLGTSASAALIVECFEKGLEPHWSAAHDWSYGLAQKLGYVEIDAYDHFIIKTAEHSQLKH